MCFWDWLFIQCSPAVWLITLADLQQIASDRTPTLVQRSRPYEHQGVVSYLPELQIIRATCGSEELKNYRRFGPEWDICVFSFIVRTLHTCFMLLFCAGMKINITIKTKWMSRTQLPLHKDNLTSQNEKTSLNLPRRTPRQHVEEVTLCNDF